MAQPATSGAPPLGYFITNVTVTPLKLHSTRLGSLKDANTTNIIYATSGINDAAKFSNTLYMVTYPIILNQARSAWGLTFTLLLA